MSVSFNKIDGFWNVIGWTSIEVSVSQIDECYAIITFHKWNNYRAASAQVNWIAYGSKISSSENQ